MSQSLWDSLDSATQELIMECANEARDYQYEQIDTMLETLQAEMGSRRRHLLRGGYCRMAAACAPIYEKYVGTGEGQIDPELVEKIQQEAAAVA